MSSDTSNSRDLRMETISSAGRSVPRKALIFSGSSRSVLRSGILPLMSTKPETTSPASSSSTSSSARVRARRVFSGSRPFSNLTEDSVFMPRPFSV